jgi:hypothetical protein
MAFRSPRQSRDEASADRISELQDKRRHKSFRWIQPAGVTCGLNQ